MKRIVLALMIILNICLCSCFTENLSQLGNDSNLNDIKRLEESSLNTNTQSVKLNSDSNKITTNDKIKDFVEKFISLKTKAMNENEFALIEGYLKPNSRIYSALKAQTAYFNILPIKQKIVGYEISTPEIVKNMDGTKKAQNFSVLVTEKLDIKYPESEYAIGVFPWKYSISIQEDKFYLMDMAFADNSDSVSFINKSLLTPRPTIVPEKRQEDKNFMVNSSMKGIKEYFEVDITKKEGKYNALGCNFAYGKGLIRLLGSFEQRKAQIDEKIISRKILMLEIKRIQHSEVAGFVELAIKVETISKEGLTTGEYDLKVYLISQGQNSWYIYDIDGLDY